MRIIIISVEVCYASLFQTLIPDISHAMGVRIQ